MLVFALLFIPFAFRPLLDQGCVKSDPCNRRKEFTEESRGSCNIVPEKLRELRIGIIKSIISF